MRSRTTILALSDILGVTLVFCTFVYFKPGEFTHVFNQYHTSFLFFLSIWLIVSFATDKYNIFGKVKINKSVKQILFGNILIMGIVTSLMYLIRIDYYSRTVVFGTILGSTAFELIGTIIYFSFHNAVLFPADISFRAVRHRRSFLRHVGTLQEQHLRYNAEFNARKEAILEEIGEESFEFILNYTHIESPKTLVTSTDSRFNIDTQLEHNFESIVNLKRINDVRYINKFFESINSKLPLDGIFIDFFESKALRKKRILKKFPPLINYIAYTIDFIVKRVFPKFALTKGIYFILTRGQNRVITKAETFGRLYSCGFEVLDEKMVKNHLFFVARKTGDPQFPENPSYGPLIALERVGYKGKMIKVYKIRTMHPYAEYLQEYIYNLEGLQEGGKFKDDFRISTIGKFLRALWLDEFPMFLNLLNGDMKIVGVRPLSQHYFSLYTKEHQERRIKYKPGLVPPFYVDNPKTLEEIMASELKYMNEYDKHPLRTDFVYFFKAFFNIVFKKYRSK